MIASDWLMKYVQSVYINNEILFGNDNRSASTLLDELVYFSMDLYKHSETNEVTKKQCHIVCDAFCLTIQVCLCLISVLISGVNKYGIFIYIYCKQRVKSLYLTLFIECASVRGLKSRLFLVNRVNFMNTIHSTAYLMWSMVTLYADDKVGSNKLPLHKWSPYGSDICGIFLFH